MRPVEWWTARLPEAEVDFLIHVLPERGIIFVTNPKVASSTLKATLLQWHAKDAKCSDQLGQVHDKGGTPFKSPSEFGFREFMLDINSANYARICFVRNPYVRLLSCYLDKVKGTEDEPRRMRRKLGLPDVGNVDFSEFVEAVAACSWYGADRHWRAQTENLLWGGIRYDFVGKFEFLMSEFDRLASELDMNFRDCIHNRRHHAKNATLHLDDYYNETLQARVYEVYRCDFDAFGYGYELPGTERLEQADAVARESVMRFPNDAWGYIQRAEIAMRRQAWGPACESWSEIRRLFPDEVVGFQRGGEALLSAGNIDEAEVVAAEAIKRFGHRSCGYVQRAEVAMRRRDWNSACARLAEVRRLFPERAMGFVRGAAALLRAGHVDEAEAMAREAILRFPDHVGGHVQLGEASMRRGDWETACDRWAEVRRRFPERSVGFQRGQVALKRASRREEAAALAAATAARFPGASGDKR